jgi:hypothetical protein
LTRKQWSMAALSHVCPTAVKESHRRGNTPLPYGLPD